jgi:hypothetical protein
MASRVHAVNFDESDVHKPELLVSRSAIREKQRSALRLHIGRGRRYSVREASEGSGVPERQIEAAMAFIDDENYRPLSLENSASLSKFLGITFVSAMLEPMGFGAFELMDGQAPLPRMLDACASPSDETVTEKRRRLIRELGALEEV